MNKRDQAQIYSLEIIEITEKEWDYIARNEDIVNVLFPGDPTKIYIFAARVVLQFAFHYAGFIKQGESIN